jgi:RNA polymerase sigma-70 factor (ECF subfamily)
LLQHFLDAARGGNLAELATLLRDDVVVWSDGGGKARAARQPIEGAVKTARFMAGIYGRATQLEVVELNGSPAAVVTTPRSRHTVSFATDRGRISALYLVSNPDKLPGVNDSVGI